MNWEIKKTKEVLKTAPFNVEEVTLLHHKTPINKPYYRLNMIDWVNVLAITKENKALLIKQYRVGSDKLTIEIPGGGVDPHENTTPDVAALRELEEETGYTSKELISLGDISPNPAIQTNKVHMFLALNCYLNEERKHFPDENEDIEIELTDPKKLNQLVRAGYLDHSLAALTIMLAAKYIEID